jgi:hypothetical protein
MTDKHKEPLDDVISRRNHLLEQLFHDCDIDIRLIGEKNKPMIVYDEIAFLSAYVRNFNLIFTLDSASKSMVGKVKIRKEHGMDYERMMAIMQRSTHRAVMKICQKDIQLCLVGYGYREPEKGEGRYPVFGRYKHKVFYKQDQVVKLCDDLNEDGYKVRVWVPAFDHKNQLKITSDGR